MFRVFVSEIDHMYLIYNLYLNFMDGWVD